ncbi:MAG: dihydroorotate dehydrogenase [Chloroflexota bacterium]|nr:dihydroorotate dehydrogenase [Chloroflexota bacterium]
MNLAVQIAPNHPKGLLIKNPIMTASGTFGYGTECAEIVDVENLGAIVCKGTTLKPREGNPQPRLYETPSGLLNSIGLQNIGVEALIREKAAIWKNWNVPVIVNIAGESIDDYSKLAAILDGVPGIHALEVNISCPNINAGGMEFGKCTEAAAQVTASVKSSSGLPVIIKLTPIVTDIVEMATCVAEAGADCICLANTFPGMSIDVTTKSPFLGNVVGGLSGPAIKPIVLRLVYEVFDAVTIPIIGCGGIMSATDALEFIMAGATAIQVGTATFVEPSTCLKVLAGIQSFMQDEGIADLSQIIGVAH